MTKPDPRPYAYGEFPKHRLNYLILPFRIDYDPGMNDIEAEIRRRMPNYNITIVVPDYYRGIGEMLARRNGLDYLVVNLDLDGGTNLPTLVARNFLNDSKTARRALLRRADQILAGSDSPFLAKIKKTMAAMKSDKPIKLFEPKYHQHHPPECNAVATPVKKRKKKKS